MEIDSVLGQVGVSKLKFCQALELCNIFQNMISQVTFHHAEIT